MIYCFDLDNTLCRTNGSDYENSEPIHKRIQRVNELYEEGHTIIIDTARGAISGRNHMYYTLEQLKSWGLKFHTLRTGEKFNADVFVDDRAISDKDFFDDQFAESGSGQLTNLLIVERVRKEATAERMEKLIDEYKFLNSIPNEFKEAFPTIIHYGKVKDTSFYEMQHYNMPSMRRLIFNKQISKVDLLKWTDKIINFNKKLLTFEEQPVDDSYMHDLHWSRYYDRRIELSNRSKVFEKVFKEEKLTINESELLSPNFIVDELVKREKELRPKKAGKFSHSDLHFSNILLDLEKEKFIFIDPRGYPRCDINYDLGKVWHSVNGKYEMVANGFWTKGAGLDYSLIKNDYFNFLEDLKEPIAKILCKYSLENSKAEAMKLIEFNEAMHFITLVPFQIVDDGIEDKALVAFAIGVELLNDFWRKYYE